MPTKLDTIVIPVQVDLMTQQTEYLRALNETLAELRADYSQMHDQFGGPIAHKLPGALICILEARTEVYREITRLIVPGMLKMDPCSPESIAAHQAENSRRGP